jgi:F-type H+-transporting ATPase subunit delta
MARRTTAARRYADAAFQMAREERALDRWERELSLLCDLLRDPQLKAVADHPAIPYAAKERIIRAAADKEIAREPLELVLLMIRRGRPRGIEPMVDRFDELLRRARGISKAEIRSALPLQDDERSSIVARLGELTGDKIQTSEEVDESLIGGVAVRIGDTLYDASVRSRLERLRARLTVA